MIRVLVVDDHPAVRAGLVAILRTEPGLVPVAAAADPGTALTEAQRRRPDVAIVDYHLREDDGLVLCRKLKSLADPPRVLIYSAFAGTDLALPASVAGADGLADKGIPAEELFERVRTVARGGTRPSVSPRALAEGAATLDTADLPIMGMLLDRTPRAEIAEVLGLEQHELDRRVDAMLGRLGVRTGHHRARV